MNEWSPYEHIDPGTPIAEDMFLKVGGKTFACDCGCRIFRPLHGFKKYRCNACNARWTGE